MQFITMRVALGGLDDASDVKALRAHRIGAVLSIAPVAIDAWEIEQVNLAIKDREPVPFDAIEEGLAFLSSRVRAGKRVLLHCHMGISRSPALAVCYLVRHMGMDVDAALQHVQAIRPVAAPHPAVMKSVRRFCRDGKALASVPWRKHAGLCDWQAESIGAMP